MKQMFMFFALVTAYLMAGQIGMIVMAITMILVLMLTSKSKIEM